MRKILYEYYIQCRVDVGIIFVVFVNIYNVCVWSEFPIIWCMFYFCCWSVSFYVMKRCKTSDACAFVYVYFVFLLCISIDFTMNSGLILFIYCLCVNINILSVDVRWYVVLLLFEPRFYSISSYIPNLW